MVPRIQINQAFKEKLIKVPKAKTG